jgi:hypothetical protein
LILSIIAYVLSSWSGNYLNALTRLHFRDRKHFGVIVSEGFGSVRFQSFGGLAEDGAGVIEDFRDLVGLFSCGLGSFFFEVD